VFHAEVSVVAPTIDSQTRTRRVKAVLPNPDGGLLPGTFARVDLGVARRSGVVMVPKEAVQIAADGSVLYRLVGEQRVERLLIETGTHHDGRVEIQGDVAAGDWIVVRGQGALVDGSPVSLRQPDGVSATETVGATTSETGP
jgi:RND family efflux transporter MFP subunit